MDGALQVSAAEYQAVIQTVVADAAYPALRDGVGLRRLDGRSDLPNSQCCDASIKVGAETTITVVDQETGRCRIWPASFDHLLGQPVRVRTRGNPCVHNLSSTVVDDEEDAERAKPQ